MLLRRAEAGAALSIAAAGAGGHALRSLARRCLPLPRGGEARLGGAARRGASNRGARRGRGGAGEAGASRAEPGRAGPERTGPGLALHSLAPRSPAGASAAPLRRAPTRAGTLAHGARREQAELTPARQAPPPPPPPPSTLGQAATRRDAAAAPPPLAARARAPSSQVPGCRGRSGSPTVGEAAPQALPETTTVTQRAKPLSSPSLPRRCRRRRWGACAGRARPSPRALLSQRFPSLSSRFSSLRAPSLPDPFLHALPSRRASGWPRMRMRVPRLGPTP